MYFAVMTASAQSVGHDSDSLYIQKTYREKRLAGNDDGKTIYPKNSYSGLNSLRARLSMSGNSWTNDHNAVGGGDDNALSNTNGNHPDSIAYSDHLKVCVGVPVYFFFKLNSDKLVDESQLVNLDDIAKIAKEENLRIKISGAADNATGSQSGNHDLGKRRAKYIAKALIKRGVDKCQIQAFNPNRS